VPDAQSSSKRFRRYTVSILGVAILLAAALGVYGFGLANRAQQLEQHWRSENQRAAAAADAVGRIAAHFGYGGFIHHFKDYVLRGESERLALLAESLAATARAIHDYEMLEPGIAEQEALRDLRRVIDQYARRLSQLEQLVEAGSDALVIDAAVEVDDAPAIAALRVLAEHARARSARATPDMERNIQGLVGRLNAGLLLSPAVLLLGLLLLWFMRRLTRVNMEAQQAQHYMQDLVEAAPDPLLIVDQHGIISRVNKEAERLFGYSRHELEGQSIENLVPARHRQRHAEARQQSFRESRARPMKSNGEFMACTKGGEEIPVEIGISYSEQPDGVQAITVIRDVRERRKAEARLRLLQKVYEDMAEAILITDDQQRIVEANDAFCQLSGYSRQELVGQHPKIMQSGRHDASFYREMWQSVQAHGYWHGEVWDRNKAGEVFPIRLGLSAVSEPGSQVSHYVGVFADITALKENEERLEQLAHFDHLTGLANRLLFHDRVRTLISRASRSHSRFMVLYLDLDGFKAINDRLGHEAGDEVLVMAARRLQGCLRDEDTVARLGGDEFGVLVADLKNDRHAERVADKVLRALTWRVEMADEELPLSVSIGMAMYPRDGEEEAVLIRKADQAMYRAKREGKHAWRAVPYPVD
jgi:diguanylate cyclase (GGDEF)-like protein/PAS domain S-box-containing protein